MLSVIMLNSKLRTFLYALSFWRFNSCLFFCFWRQRVGFLLVGANRHLHLLMFVAFRFSINLLCLIALSCTASKDRSSHNTTRFDTNKLTMLTWLQVVWSYKSTRNNAIFVVYLCSVTGQIWNFGSNRRSAKRSLTLKLVVCCLRKMVSNHI